MATLEEDAISDLEASGYGQSEFEESNNHSKHHKREESGKNRRSKPPTPKERRDVSLIRTHPSSPLRSRQGSRDYGSSTQESLEHDNQRNKEFVEKVREHIYSCLVMMPEIDSRARKVCGCFGFLFYVVLFIWGVVIITLTSQATGTTNKLIYANVLTILSGIFFVVLGFYWMLVYWWNKVSKRVINLWVITVLWFILMMYFIGVASALAIEICEHNKELVTCSKDKFVPQCIPLLSVLSMAVLFIFYVSVFIIRSCVAFGRYQ